MNMKSYLVFVLFAGLLAAQSQPPNPALEKARRQQGKQLLQRAQQAMGGAAKLAAVKDVMHKMEIILEPVAGGFKLQQTSLFVAPNHFRQEQEMPFGDVMIYSDGRDGWLSTPQGVQPIPAEVLSAAKGVIFRQPSTLLLPDHDASRTVNAAGDNAVEISTTDGWRVRLEFDATTGLPARQMYSESGPQGSVRERMETLSDWRAVDGIKMPYKAVQQENGAKMLEVTVTGYRINSGMTAAQLRSKPAGVQISLKSNTEKERRKKSQLERLFQQYELSKWIFTRSILIDEQTRIPHSHPVLTLNTNELQDDLLTLSTFIHEQLHWFEEANPKQRNNIIAELKKFYPDAPGGPPEGARDKYSTYLHLIVCHLEYEGMKQLVGNDKAKQVIDLLSTRYYRWIYRTVLSDGSKLKAVFEQQGLKL